MIDVSAQAIVGSASPRHVILGGRGGKYKQARCASPGEQAMGNAPVRSLGFGHCLCKSKQNNTAPPQAAFDDGVLSQ